MKGKFTKIKYDDFYDEEERKFKYKLKIFYSRENLHAYTSSLKSLKSVLYLNGKRFHKDINLQITHIYER